MQYVEQGCGLSWQRGRSGGDCADQVCRLHESQAGRTPRSPQALAKLCVPTSRTVRQAFELLQLTDPSEFGILIAMSTEKLVELAQTVPREAFIAQVPARFLVLGGSANDEQPMSFATQVFRAPSRALGHEELIVLPVVKAANNPYADRVSVGRARNCDIVVREPSVSKLHAVVRIDGDSFSLVDIGSQNGTYLNGQRLVANEAALIALNDEILFGNVNARFMDAASVHAILISATTKPESSGAT